MNFIDSGVVKEWLANNNAMINDSLSDDLFYKLSSLPWEAGHIDYEKLNHRSADIQEMLSHDGDIIYDNLKAFLKE
uniref:hypothetical protein n=2 Tax=Enterobacterales TaxID=91347 RepID=UPI0026714788